MNATTFDSLSVARRLKAAGMEGKQAEAIAEIMFEAIVAPGEGLLKKTDLAVVKSDLDAFEIRFKAEISSHSTGSRLSRLPAWSFCRGLEVVLICM